MAEENLVGWRTSYYTGKPYLHTYSRYNPESYGIRALSKDDSDSAIKRQIDMLQKAEIKAYQKMFGLNCTSYALFKQNITTKLNNPAVKRCFLNFSNEGNSLVNKLEIIRANYVAAKTNKPWALQIQFDKQELDEKLKQVDEDTKALFNTMNFSATDSGLSLGTLILHQLDIAKIKNVLNIAIGRHLKAQSSDLRALDKILDKDISNDEIGAWLQSGNNKYMTTLHPNYNDPFMYRWRDLKNEKNDAETTKGIAWIRDSIRHDFLEVDGAPESLLYAFDRVWETNIGTKKEAWALFMKGGDTTSLIGSFGEFQTSLLSFFLTDGQNDNAGYVSITVGKEQQRRDVSWLDNIGIQVKNYSKNNLDEFGVTTYADTLKNKNLIPQNQSLFTFLANYYFNTDYAETSYAQTDFNTILQDIFPSYFAGIANFELAEDLNSGDVVSFYFISGRYLVPGSIILQWVYNTNIRPQVEISSRFHGMSDADYFDYKKDRQGDQSKPAPYESYWIYEDDDWTPTDYNNIDNVLKTISIKSHFMRNMDELVKYDLFS